MKKKLKFIKEILPYLESPFKEIIQKVLEGKSVSIEDSILLYEAPLSYMPTLMSLANFLRDKYYGNVISYSKNVFIDVTHLCRNRCGYCGFRKEPGELKSLILKPIAVLQLAHKGKTLGCTEALITLGEKPELKYPSYTKFLHSIGNYSTTTEYICDLCKKIFSETGLLPHSNLGILDKNELKELKEVNASLGLMLENSSPLLSQKDAPHELSPGKDPKLRTDTIKLAGELNIPFTTGLLIGIGENHKERIKSIFTIKDLHDKYGHIQEIILQNFIPQANTKMDHVPPPSPIELMKLSCITRIIFNGKMNVQVPPNLNPAILEFILMSGMNDWGGISPLTIDYINPEYRWPSIQHLTDITIQAGLSLRQRLPIYPEFIIKDNFVSKSLKNQINSLADKEGFVKTGTFYEKSKLK